MGSESTKEEKTVYLSAELLSHSDTVEEAIEKYKIPFFISHEYRRLYQMVKDGQTTGALFEMKDVVEVMLKFPVLLGLGFLMQPNFEQELKDSILSSMLKRELSLGDWLQKAKQIRKIMKRVGCSEVIIRLLENVIQFFDRYGVVNWRNNMIGHGALPFENDTDFIHSFNKLSEGINECLELSLEYYREIKLYCGDKFIRALDDITGYPEKEITVKIGDAKDFSMGSFMINQKYFFDGFYRKLFKTSCLDYIFGKKQMRDIEFYTNMYRCLQNINKVSEDITVPITTRDTEFFLLSLNSPDKYYEFDYLSDWLQNRLQQKKGVFLLKMDRGMGKTAFAASLDPLSNRQNTQFDDCYTRVYYCSELAYRTVADFVDSVNTLYKLHYNGNEDYIRENFAKLKIGDTGRQLGAVLGDILNKIRDREFVEKIMLVIDGLDEINNTNSDIFNYIPYEHELPDNVYILLTCRNEDSVELSTQLRRELSCITEQKIGNNDNLMEISLHRESGRRVYNKHLKKYIRSYLHQKNINPDTDLFNDHLQDQIISFSDNRFLYVKLMLEMVVEYYEKNYDYQIIFDSGNILETFLSYIERVFGSKLFADAKRILMIIATSYIPLTLTEICFLNDVSKISIPTYVLVILKTFDSILMKIRTLHGTCYKFANEVYRKAIIKKYGAKMPVLISEWESFIQDTYKNNKTGYYDKSIYENRAEIYLNATLYKYMTTYLRAEDLNDAEKFNELGAAILEYENHMPAIQKGLQQRLWDMDMTDSVIKMMELLKSKGKNYDKRILALAYNNFVYHYKDSPESQYNMEKILSYYDCAISEMKACTNITEGKKWVYLSRFYSVLGVYLNQHNGNRKDVENDFQNSYQFCLRAMDEGELNAYYSYLPSVIRVLNCYNPKDPQAIIDFFDEATAKLKVIKKKLQKTGEDGLIYNSDRRIEFGIFAQEALLYRKMANILSVVKPDNPQAEMFYKQSIQCFENLISCEIKPEEAERVNQDYWVVLFEFGRYLYNNDKTAAEQQFDLAVDKIEPLVTSEKLSGLGNKYLKELLQLWCDIKEQKNCEEHTKKRMLQFREWIKKW